MEFVIKVLRRKMALMYRIRKRLLEFLRHIIRKMVNMTVEVKTDRSNSKKYSLLFLPHAVLHCDREQYIFFLLANVGRISKKNKKLLCTRWSCRVHKCAFNVTLCFMSSKCVITRRFSHSHNINFLRWSWMLRLDCGVLSFSNRCLFCWILLYGTHFSSPVI